MLVILLPVQKNKAWREVYQTNHQDKHRETSSNFCYTLNPWEHMPSNIKSNEVFFKKYILVERFSSNK